MKLLEKDQLVGTCPGCACFRDLFGDADGNRVSVKTSRDFWIEDERTTPEGKLTACPSQEVMLAKHRLP
jgi:hypothetical protein